MKSSRWHAILALVCLLATAPAAWPQQNQPRIGYVFPAGGRQGTTFRLTVGGQYLNGVSAAHLSGKGVQARIIEHIKPLTPKEFNLLRDRLKELQDRKLAANRPLRPAPGEVRPDTRPTWTAEHEKELAEIRVKLARYIRKPSSPAIAETVTVEVTIAANAEPGQRDMRLEASSRLTNPLTFCVGQLAEFVEKEPRASAAPAEMPITLPAVANGQIMPGDVDRFRFKARKGQRIVAATGARSLIPYLADAVPGWFQATLALYDAQGREVAFADDYRFNPDPVLCCLIPADGEYILEITDAIYRGREDFVYRAVVGELPFITSIFPLGGTAGATATVQLKGWNLPTASILWDRREVPPGLDTLFARSGRLLSNSVPFALDNLPESLEKEPNQQINDAHSVTLPLILNGRINPPGDVDVFCFEGRAGQEIVAEVNARRLGSPLDSLLRLTDASGRQLAINDDHEDKGAALLTHHADSLLRFKLPGDGAYCIALTDAQGQGGGEHGYRLRISEPRPDYELRIVPSSISSRGGTNEPLTVYALRKDGFAGDITLSLKDAPPGFTLSGNRVPAGQDRIRLTLAVPPKATAQPIPLRIEGMATAQNRRIIRPAVPAEDMMQAFAYRHLVPARDLLVAVSGRSMSRTPMRILSDTPLDIPANGTATLRVAIPASMSAGKVELELNEPHEGLSIRRVVAGRGRADVVLQADSAKAKPGLAGNLVFDVFFERPAAADRPQANRRRSPVGTLPAVAFRIVAP